MIERTSPQKKFSNKLMIYVEIIFPLKFLNSSLCAINLVESLEQNDL
jgi:hypothetical protein